MVNMALVTQPDFFSSFGGVKGDFLVQGSDGGGTFCLHFWNLHKIWI